MRQRPKWHTILGLLAALAIPARAIAQNDDADVPRAARRAVVGVLTYDGEGNVLGRGVGFVVNAQGHLVTDFHLLRGAARAEVKTFDGKALPIKAVPAEDREVGLVRISLDTPQPFTSAPLPFNERSPRPTETVWVVVPGAPEEFTAVTLRERPGCSAPVWETGRLLQTKTEIPSNATGAPVVNHSGEVVGIVTRRKVEGETATVIFPIRQASVLKPHAPIPFAKWAQTYGKVWEETAEGLCVQGLVVRLAKGGGRAKPYFEKAVEKDPTSAEAWFYLAHSRKMTQQPAEALVAAKKAVELGPDDPRAYYVLGEAYITNRRTLEAIQSFQKAVELKPDFIIAYYYMAKCHLRLNQGDEAVAAYERVSQLEPSAAIPWYALGWQFNQSGQFPASVAAFEQAVRRRPKSARRHHALACSLYDIGSFRSAMLHFRQAERFTGYGYSLYMWYGLSCQYLGRWHEMAYAWEKALREKPKSSYPHNFTAWGRLGSGRLDEAEAEFERAREVWDEFAQPYCGLAWVAYERRQFAEAVRLFDEAIGRKPSYVDALFGRGAACRRVGRRRDAIAYFERALRFEPNHAGSRYELGLVYLEMGERERALRQCDVLVDLDTGLAADLLRRIDEVPMP